MNPTLGSYQEQLLLALRTRGIPGQRIAEALAEVDSHVTETGEDPYRAFGQPKEYAERLSEAAGSPEGLSWRSILRSFTWRDGAMFAMAMTSGGLLFLGTMRIATIGLRDHVAIGSSVAGLVVLAALAGWMKQTIRQEADPILDPRTGRDMTPPFPRWRLMLWALLSVGVTLIVYFIVGTD